MAERIELPPMLQGDERSQLQQLWSYLYQMSEALNNNLQAIGGNELTDSERQVMNRILGDVGENAQNISEVETLKSLIIKTADFVQTSLQEYRMKLLGESVASGQFGRYVRHTGLDVAVTPEGITQNYSFEEVVQGLKEFSINAKNYIKTGLLRTVLGIPVYGVAIGKDVVTFSEDGTETYNDGNKVAELTAEELSFWQNSVKIAGYTGSRISFYYGGNEVFYIQQGKLYAVGDIEITSGKKLILASGSGLDVSSGGNMNVKSGGKLTLESGGDVDIKTGGKFTVQSGQFGIDAQGNATFGGNLNAAGGTFSGNLNAAGGTFSGDLQAAGGTFSGELQAAGGTFNGTVTAGSWKVYEYGLSYVKNDDKYMIATAGVDVWPPVGQPNAAVKFFKDSLGYPGIDIGISTYSGGITTRIGLLRLRRNTSDRYQLYPDYVGYGSGIDFGSDNHPIPNVYYTNLIQGSSRKIKHDIRSMESMGEKLDALEPVTFIYNNDREKRRRHGLIYEETVGVMPEICTEKKDGIGINYVELIPILLKEIQDLRRRVSELEGGQ